jgi:capsular exopolysaccharide synthesis family protein
MNDNNGQMNLVKKEVPKKEKTLLEIFQLILKNKYILIGSILFFLIIAILYSFIATPKFEATTTLKKESNPENNRRIATQDISTMLSLQSLDAIETEMKLITTTTVIGKVVDDLDLNIIISSIDWTQNNSYKIEKVYLACLEPSFLSNIKGKFFIPSLFEVSSSNFNEISVGSYYIKKDNDTSYSLFSDLTNNKITSSIIDTNFNSAKSILRLSDSDNKKVYLLKTDQLVIKINWSEAPSGSKIYFTLNDFPTIVRTVTNNTKVSREGKTDIFTISFTSSSASISAIVVNKIVDEFRNTRMQQKKEAIRYSFDFVDKQLSEIQDKLKNAETELSGFKSSGQIMSIDASSQELMGFLSNLEAEKYNTDLQLSDLKNKAADLEKELKKSGYFDQSFLNPQDKIDGGNSPFSQLMRQLSDLELQRLELLQKRTENHPDVIAIDDQIKLAKSRLAGFNENTITAYKIMINTLEKKLLKINDLMSKYEVKMRSLPSQENKLAQLSRQRGTYERIYTILLDQREAMRVAELSSMQDITIVDIAQIPQKPSWPNKPLLIIISIVLGGFWGILLIFSLEMYRTRYINLDELESEFQVPILSIIPKYSKQMIKELNNSKSEYKLVTFIGSDDGLTETYRLFRTKLYQKLDHNTKSIMITSCEENSGKTSIAGNLAVSLSQEGKSVLLVDCDLRKGDLSKMFGLNVKDPGLIDYLTKEVNPKIYSRVSKLIDIIPAGGYSEESGTILNSPRMKKLFNHLTASNYDIILFDSPPVTRVVDALVLAQFIKDVIIVVRPNLSLIETVRWGMQELKQAGVKIKGIVVNAATIENSYYYRYKYGYGYGYGKENGKGKLGKFKTSIKVE